jgi:hypothetical protein
MFRMLRLTALSKAEADAIADENGIERREVRHATRGWTYTALRFNGEPCGEITPQKVGIPFTMEIDLDRVDSRTRFRLCS